MIMKPEGIVRASLAVGLAVALLGLLWGAVRSSGFSQAQIQPAPNTHNAAPNTSIVITFAASIEPFPNYTYTIPIFGEQHGWMPGAYEVDQQRLEITPTHQFFPGELVHGVVTTDLLAASQTPLDHPIVWQFRAAVEPSLARFAVQTTELDSTSSVDIALGDLDGDGDLDIFLAHRDAASTVWLNNGDGHFTTDHLDLGNDFMIDVTLGDVDRDSDLDALITGIQNDRLWLNDGAGTFHLGGWIFPDNPTILGVALGDLDGDGDLDAGTVTRCDVFDPDPVCTYAEHQIWWNDGSGTFLYSGHTLGSSTVEDLAFGDLDGDEDLDAMTVSTYPAGSTVWLNMGAGVFHGQKLAGLLASSVNFGDLDGDKDLDAFVSPNSGISAVWLNDGSGTLSAGQHLGALGPARLADLDGDGDLDALTFGIRQGKVWLNQGNATFVPSGQNLAQAFTTGFDLGDVDGDGDLDMVTSGYDRTPALWLNESVLHFWLPLLKK